MRKSLYNTHCVKSARIRTSKITLEEENNIRSGEEEIANIMNNCFTNVTKALNLKKQHIFWGSGANEFENHISIKMIHEK